VIIRDDCGPAPIAIGNGPMKITTPLLAVPPEETEANIISTIPTKIMMNEAAKRVSAVDQPDTILSGMGMAEVADICLEQV